LEKKREGETTVKKKRKEKKMNSSTFDVYPLYMKAKDGSRHL
jgi:hypothetical protein